MSSPCPLLVRRSVSHISAQDEIYLLRDRLDDFEDISVKDKGRSPPSCVLVILDRCWFMFLCTLPIHSSKQATRIDHDFLVMYTVQRRRYEPTRGDRTSRRFLYTRERNINFNGKTDQNSKLGMGGVEFVVMYRVK